MATTQSPNESTIHMPPTSGSLVDAITQFNTVPPQDRDQFLDSFPGLRELITAGSNKEKAAEALSTISSKQFMTTISHALQSQPPFMPTGLGGPPIHGIPVADPGPSSHPHGPPDLSQSAAVASAIVDAAQHAAPEEQEDDKDDGEENDRQMSGGPQARPRSSRSANMGTEEWARQRKDNHKEVERRRRGNINEGINELGRIVPNGSGEKAKGAILSRAVQYIHHLKENEARNIEKWTLEKLLMDQAMGDLQSQLDEMRRMWEEERTARTRAEGELELLRGLQLRGGQLENGKDADKVEKEDGANQQPDEEARLGKRQRVE